MRASSWCRCSQKLTTPCRCGGSPCRFLPPPHFFHLVILLDAACCGHYFNWIHECKAPLRWIEYSISASIMLWTIALTGGLKDVYLLVALAVLCFVTMTYGYFTEALSRPDMQTAGYRMIESIKTESTSIYGGPTKWLTRSRWHRLMPHILGYIPYLTAYGIILHSFYYNATRLPSTAQGPPEWVERIIWGQFFLFTVFGVSQLAQQWSDMGCERYIVWEAVYILLSLVAKMVLGLTLVGNVFAYSSFDEAIAAS